MRYTTFALALVLICPALGLPQAAQTMPGPERASILENERTVVLRVSFAVGSGEQTHTHPFDLVISALTKGDMRMTIGSETTTGIREPGHVFYVPRNTPHALVNAGKAPFEVMAVGIK